MYNSSVNHSDSDHIIGKSPTISAKVNPHIA